MHVLILGGKEDYWQDQPGFWCCGGRWRLSSCKDRRGSFSNRRLKRSFHRPFHTGPAQHLSFSETDPAPARILVYRDVNADSATLQRTRMLSPPPSLQPPATSAAETETSKEELKHPHFDEASPRCGANGGSDLLFFFEKKGLTPACPRALGTCADLDAESKSTLFPVELAPRSSCYRAGARSPS